MKLKKRNLEIDLEKLKKMQENQKFKRIFYIQKMSVEQRTQLINSKEYYDEEYGNEDASKEDYESY